MPDRAVESFAGVGNPFSLRRLQSGERIVDVGSGAGFDSFIAAGQVTDSQTRLAIVAATVSVSPGGQSVLTDFNGNFSVNVRTGTYTVTAKASGYSSGSQTVTVNGGQKTNLVFRLVGVTASGSLNGSVTDSLSGNPTVGATVTLSDGMVRVTDLNGSFSYAIVLTGSYTLTVSAVGYVTQSQIVTVKTGKTTNVQISLARS